MLPLTFSLQGPPLKAVLNNSYFEIALEIRRKTAETEFFYKKGHRYFPVNFSKCFKHPLMCDFYYGTTIALYISSSYLES